MPLVCDLPDWQQMYVESGYGLACNPDDINSIRTALQWFLEHPDKILKMGQKGIKKIETEWNYEQRFQPVLDILNGPF